MQVMEVPSFDDDFVTRFAARIEEIWGERERGALAASAVGSSDALLALLPTEIRNQFEAAVRYVEALSTQGFIHIQSDGVRVGRVPPELAERGLSVTLPPPLSEWMCDLAEKIMILAGIAAVLAFFLAVVAVVAIVVNPGLGPVSLEVAKMFLIITIVALIVLLGTIVFYGLFCRNRGRATRIEWRPGSAPQLLPA